MAYRSDVEAMEARLADLENQVGDVTRERDELARIIADARARDRRQAIFEDLKAGGPTRRLYRNAAITVGAVAVAALGVVAYRATRTSKTDQLMKELGTFADKMCSCKDKACSDEVNAEMTKWGVEASKESDSQELSDPEAMKRMSADMEKYTACLTKLMSIE